MQPAITEEDESIIVILKHLKALKLIKKLLLYLVKCQEIKSDEHQLCSHVCLYVCTHTHIYESRLWPDKIFIEMAV